MKKYLLCFYLIFIFYFSNSESIIIGLAEPFTHNESSGTVFIRNNLIFELFASLDDSNIQFYSIGDNSNNLEKYIKNNVTYAVSNNINYLLLVETYSYNNKIFIFTKILDPYNNIDIQIKNYSLEFDIKINERLNDIAKKIIDNIFLLNLKNNIKKNIVKESSKQIIEKKENSNLINSLILTLNNYPKNEVFIMNGFLKNNSNLFSILNIYTGYSRYLSDGFFVDFGFFGGIGSLSDKIDFDFLKLNDGLVGAFSGLHFYIKGIIEPNFGARIEFSYSTQKNLLLSIPIDLGIKIFISNKNVLRLNTSFPFNTYDILNNKWDKKMTLGIMVGYGFKI